MQMQMHTVQRLYSTKQGLAARHVAEWHWVHTVLPATHTFIHECNKPPCMHFVSIHQMASLEQGGAHLDQLTAHQSTLKG